MKIPLGVGFIPTILYTVNSRVSATLAIKTIGTDLRNSVALDSPPRSTIRHPKVSANTCLVLIMVDNRVLTLILNLMNVLDRSDIPHLRILFTL